MIYGLKLTLKNAQNAKLSELLLLLVCILLAHLVNINIVGYVEVLGQNMALKQAVITNATNTNLHLIKLKKSWMNSNFIEKDMKPICKQLNIPRICARKN
jgi:hypothetical protein